MFPSSLPVDVKATKSERQLFQALAEKLPDEYYVYFAVPFIDGAHARQGEVDFIILHPAKGMLFLEVKGGGVERDEDGQWYRKKGKRREPMKQSPIEQVRKQVESLVTKFRAPFRRIVDVKGRFPMVYGWALAFPFTVASEQTVPPDVEPSLFLDAGLLEAPEAMIAGAFDFWARALDGDPPRVTVDAFHRFRREVLSPEVRYVPNLGGALVSERAEMQKVSDTQLAYARAFLANGRLMVSGGAGTGKTVLAMYCADLLAMRGKNVLVLCFNRALADHLRVILEEHPPEDGSIYATNFHRLCFRAADALGRKLEVPDDYAEQKTFWVEEAPLTLWEAIEAGKLGPWDAVIVDEGQDFAPDWWEILDRGVSEGGHLAAFYDDSQSLFDHGGELPDLGAKFPLTYNFRNTKAIASVLKQLVPGEWESHPDCPEGAPPTVIRQQGPAWTRRKLGELIGDLMARHGIKYHQMAILTPRTPKNSVLEAATELEGIPIVHELGARDEGVFHTSIAGFKGLEADIVFMLDIDPAHKRCSAKARYVAASRARLRLYVFERAHWLSR